MRRRLCDHFETTPPGLLLPTLCSIQTCLRVYGLRMPKFPQRGRKFIESATVSSDLSTCTKKRVTFLSAPLLRMQRIVPIGVSIFHQVALLLKEYFFAIPVVVFLSRVPAIDFKSNACVHVKVHWRRRFQSNLDSMSLSRKAQNRCIFLIDSSTHSRWYVVHQSTSYTSTPLSKCLKFYAANTMSNRADLQTSQDGPLHAVHCEVALSLVGCSPFPFLPSW